MMIVDHHTIKIRWLVTKLRHVKNKSISSRSSKHIRRSIINGVRFICWLMFFSWYLWWISNTKESTFKINRILVNRMVHINCTKKCWYFSNILGHDSTKFWFAFVVFIWYPQQYYFSSSVMVSDVPLEIAMKRLKVFQ